MADLFDLEPTHKAAPPRNLADLRRMILNATDWSPSKRKAIASSINSFGKAVGKILETIPANPQVIRVLLKGTSAAMAGYEVGSWRNIYSHLGAALDYAGIVTIATRIKAPPSPAWEALTVQLKATDHLAILSRFARCCTLKGVEPLDVNDAVMVEYLTDLELRSLVNDPARSHRETILCWNKVSAQLDGWPNLILIVPDNRLYYTPNWSTYPASLLKEIELWLAPPSGLGLFADIGRKTLRPATIESRRTHLRLYLGALVLKGVEPASMINLAAVITPEMAELAYNFHHDRAGKKLSCVNAQIARLVTAIAAHHLQMTGPALERMRAMTKLLQRPKAGMTERNKARIRRIEDEGVKDDLIELPFELCREVESASKTVQASYANHLKFQTAVAIELLLTKALRIKNLAALRIGHDLIIRPDGRVLLIIQEKEVKNHTPIETKLTPRFASMLHVYLKDHHHALGAGGAAGYLFPGKLAGRHKSHDALGSNINKVLWENIGLDATVHFFRHFAGHLIIEDNPAAQVLVQRFLGHNHLSSSEPYIGDGAKAADAHFAKLIERRRSGLALSSRKSPKGLARKVRI